MLFRLQIGPLFRAQQILEDLSKKFDAQSSLFSFIQQFKAANPDIAENFYGKWYDISRPSTNSPSEEDFKLPKTRGEFEEMISKMYRQSPVKNQLAKIIQVIIPSIFSPLLLMLPTSTLANFKIEQKCIVHLKIN